MGAPPTVRFADAPPATADVAIIGGGVVGCATAYFAARAGLSVVVLERRAALATLTTPVSTGAFRLQFDNAEEIELVREGIELFESFGARTGLDGWDLGDWPYVVVYVAERNDEFGVRTYCEGDLNDKWFATVEEQTEHTLRNLVAIADAAGGGLGDVVKVSAFLASIDDFSEFNTTYERIFAQPDGREPQPGRASFRISPVSPDGPNSVRVRTYSSPSASSPMPVTNRFRSPSRRTSLRHGQTAPASAAGSATSRLPCPIASSPNSRE